MSRFQLSGQLVNALQPTRPLTPPAQTSPGPLLPSRGRDWSWNEGWLAVWCPASASSRGSPCRRQIRASAGRADTNTYAVVRPRRMAEPDSARSRGTAGRARVTAAMEGCLIFCPVIGLASLNGTLPEAASARIGSVRAARPNLMSSGESRAWSRRSRRPRRLGVGWFSYLTPAAAHNQFGKSARSTRHR